MTANGRNHPIEAMVETYSLEAASEAYERMMNNEARFRAVIEP